MIISRLIRWGFVIGLVLPVDAIPRVELNGPLLEQSSFLSSSSRYNEPTEPEPKVIHPPVFHDDNLVDKGRYLIQFSGKPSASVPSAHRTKSFDAVLDQIAKEQQRSFEQFCITQGLNVVIQQRFTTLFNGVSAAINDPTILASVSKAPGVQAVHPMPLYKGNSGSSSSSSRNPSHQDPDSPSSSFGYERTSKRRRFDDNSGVYSDSAPWEFPLAVTNVDKLHARLPGLNGTGIKVGIIDTGIDWTHPAFTVPGKTCITFGDEGCRVKFGYNFISEYDGSNSFLPNDDHGRGTQMAGVVGGLDGTAFKGIATNVVFGAYRVYQDGLNVGLDVFLQALQVAYDDGMDIIVTPIAFHGFSRQHMLASVVDSIVDNGVYVIGAMSDDLLPHLWKAPLPATANKVIAVANYRSFFSKVTFARVSGVPELDKVIFSSQNAHNRFDENQPQVLKCIPDNIRRDSLNPHWFAGSVALINIEGQHTPVSDFVAWVARHGASGLVVYDSTDPAEYPADTLTQLMFPVAFLNHRDGSVLRTAVLSTQGVTIRFNHDHHTHPSYHESVPSASSSWGPDLNLFMKPDVSAPGTDIYTTLPKMLGSYSRASGTALSAAHVAGIIALQSQLYSRDPTRFDQTYRRLLNSCRPYVSGERYRTAESVAKVGAGLVDALGFIMNPVQVIPAKFELGDAPENLKLDRSIVRQLRLVNKGRHEISYFITKVASRAVRADVDLDSERLEFVGESMHVELTEELVTIEPGGDQLIGVNFNPYVKVLLSSKDKGHWLVSGYIALHPLKTSFREPPLYLPLSPMYVPFMFMLGDHSSMTNIATIGNHVPRLYNQLSLTHPAIAPDYLFNDMVPRFYIELMAREFPVLRAKLLFPVYQLVISVRFVGTPDIDKFQTAGYLYNESNVCTTSVVVSFQGQVYPMLDSLETVNLPPGDYAFGIHVSKFRPLWNSAMPVSSGLETVWTSPTFKIVML